MLAGLMELWLVSTDDSLLAPIEASPTLFRTTFVFLPFDELLVALLAAFFAPSSLFCSAVRFWE